MALSHSPSRWSPYVSSPSRQRLPLKFRRKPTTVLSGARSTTGQNSTPSDGTQESTSLKSFTFLENITEVAGTKPSGRVGSWTQNSSPERYSSSSVTDLSSPCLASSSPFQSSAIFSKKRKRMAHDRSQPSSKRLMTQELSSDAESDCTSETWLPAAAMNVERDYATMSPPSTPLRKRNRTTVASTPPFEAPKTQPIVNDFNGLDILASAACDNSVLDPVIISENSSPPPSPYPSTPSKIFKRTRSPSTLSCSSDILDVKPAFNRTTSSAVIPTTSQATDEGLRTVATTSTPPPELPAEPEVKADDLVQTLKPLELSHGPNNDSINVTKRKHAAAGTAQKASDDCGSSRSSGPQAKTGTKKNSGTGPSGSGLPSKTKVKPTTTSRSRKKAAPTAPSAGSSSAPSAPTVLVTPASDQHRRDTASSHNTLDRDAITGAMVSSFAFGRATSLTAPDVTDSVFELLPNLKWGATKVEKALCHQILLDECRDILNTCPAFGRVERPGEDADGNPLEAMYHYEPQNDPDTVRAANLGGLSRRKRQSTKKHVQYHYAPVSLNRWETMAEEED